MFMLAAHVSARIHASHGRHRSLRRNLSIDEELLLRKHRMWVEISSRGLQGSAACSETHTHTNRHTHTHTSLDVSVCIFVSPSDIPIDFLYVKTNTSRFIDTWLNCVGECVHVPNLGCCRKSFQLESS